MVPKCGLPMVVLPISPSSGPKPMMVFTASWWSAARPALAPATYITNSRYAPLSPRNCISRSAAFPPITCCPVCAVCAARSPIAWGASGAARACYEVALDYAKTRVQFDRPIPSFQLVQEKLAIMATELVKAQLLSLQLGRLKDEGLIHPVQISLAKRNNVREALRTAREARSVLGANGITLEYPISRHSNNLESVYTYEGTDDIHTLIIGQAITGQNAFS